MIARALRTLAKHRIAGAALLVSLLAALYWGLIASDRYVSEARIIIQRTDLAGGQSVDFGNLMPNNLDTGNRTDQLLLRDHLLSIDMLGKLDAKLNLRAHYSDGRRDLISRMWFERSALERFHDHYLSRVEVEFDDRAGVLVIRAQAYEPKKAQAIAAMLVQEGERFMNTLAQSLADEQVAFLEKQVAEIAKRVTQTRLAIVSFQNEKGMVSPQATVENYTAIVSRLEAQLADLQTRRTAMLGAYAPASPGVVELNLQIGAVEKQMAREKARLASPTDRTLNLTAEEFQRLRMNAELAQEVYKTALVALERGRVEATRTLKKVAVLQSAFEPDRALQPRRLYNTVVFTLIAFLVAGIAHLLAAIVRDHQD